jgi:Tol biopolymer transport system component
LLLDVGTQTVRTLRADSLAGAEFVAWRRDGRGWIVTRSIGRLGSEVLYVDGSGGTKMLWKSAVQQLSMPMVSPDGTRIAFGSYITESSVWRLQGF